MLPISLAAWELVQAGHEVIVVEARNRSGGRVQTLREGFTDRYIQPLLDGVKDTAISDSLAPPSPIREQ
ncbi:FAD-dependent oxidoreductase [Flavihumibacter fluvii]|uniref:FAD-dependent oxidoreductase n=1 Tax=Flavihumibacter fluvii TaxID=2838157 RepID=UPI001EFB7CB5|nr:FAD-dependent oxidoreductase [Flavihumibacter fluvii]ULQ51753.1 FAD-dependent oxidoreductase [Flavihumibacter fluvii]